MKIVVFGANGRVGSLVVNQLVKNGHDVRAFVHKPVGLDFDTSVKVIVGDIYDEAMVAQAVAGTEAVVSCLGSWGTPKKDIVSTGMRHIIAAMNTHAVKRVVSLTGADALAPGQRSNLLRGLFHSFLGLVAGKILRDGELHIQYLVDSNLDWTVIRSPIMQDGGMSFKLGVVQPKPWQKISRQAVALAMTQQVSDYTWSKQAPYIS